MVQRTYGAMTNDVLISIPLFVLMGYVMERGALVDKMFYSIQLAFRRVPASLAVATLIVCTFWGIASGLVGAVVVLMGVIAFNPMLRAGYDVKLAAGVITAGGTLGILIPPSVMIIVYAAVAGQSVVKLYAAAMFPGFFLAFLYLVYIIGWALINPEDRAAAAGGADPRAGAGLGASACRRPIRATCWSALITALFSPAQARGDRATTAGRSATGRSLTNFVDRAGAACCWSAVTLWRHLVVRRHPSASRSRRRTVAEALQQLGSAGRATSRPTPAERARRDGFYWLVRRHRRRCWRCCWCATTGAWMPRASRC